MSRDAGSASGQPQLPLTALLSQALVAFTIEFDNEAERQIMHRTTRHGSTPGGVWLTSMAMWLNCMRYVGVEPITVGDLAWLARCRTNLDGMRRWGYITLTRDPGDSRAKPPDDALLIAATRRGMRAQAVWRPLTGVIEARWHDRFGSAAIDRLTTALADLTGHLGSWLPDCLPILGYGLWSRGNGPEEDRYLAREEAARHRERDSLRPPPTRAEPALPIPWLLARVLLALAIDFERESAVSLAIGANLLRVLDESGLPVRDLPARSGVSKEALAMATDYCAKRGLVVIEPDAGSRSKIARLTGNGLEARAQYSELLASLTASWQERFGADSVGGLRAALESLAGYGGPQSPLFSGLQPDPDGWRAAVRPPLTLPHYPMVLHRGGYPDGS